MAGKTWWMSPQQMSKYEKLTKRMRELDAEHKKLMPKAKAKTLDREGWTRLRKVIDDFNAAQKERKELEDENPILPKNLVGGQDD